MHNLSKKLRRRLSEISYLSWLTPHNITESSDGTKKILYILDDKACIESVLIANENHYTLCISSQVGCAQGCKFCKTATLGLKRNLRPAEITGQILTARTLVNKFKPLTNLVFMGMGEPLDNLDNLLIALEHIVGKHGLQMSQRKITISTIGLINRLSILCHKTSVSLAISLNAANDNLRSYLMPINHRFSLSTLKTALLAYPLKPTRRITLEYVLLNGINDQPQQAQELITWTKGLKCKINLIPFNYYSGAQYKTPRNADVLVFQKILLANKLTTLIRRSRGQKINAACGMLANDINNNLKNNNFL